MKGGGKSPCGRGWGRGRRLTPHPDRSERQNLTRGRRKRTQKRMVGRDSLLVERGAQEKDR